MAIPYSCQYYYTTAKECILKGKAFPPKESKIISFHIAKTSLFKNIEYFTTKKMKVFK